MEGPLAPSIPPNSPAGMLRIRPRALTWESGMQTRSGPDMTLASCCWAAPRLVHNAGVRPSTALAWTLTCFSELFETLCQVP